MIIVICRGFNVTIRIRIIHSPIRLKIRVNAGIQTGMILNINVSISLGDSMTVKLLTSQGRRSITTCVNISISINIGLVLVIVLASVPILIW